MTEDRAAAGCQFNLGDGERVPGYHPVAPTTLFDSRSGYGWLPGQQLMAGAVEAPDALRRRFLWSRQEATFRIDLPAGFFRISILVGDVRVGAHGLSFSVRNGHLHKFPPVKPRLPWRQITLVADVSVGDELTDLLFAPLGEKWVVNGIKVEPVECLSPPHLTEEQVWLPCWPDFRSWADPGKVHRDRFLSWSGAAGEALPPGKSHDGYLHAIEGVAEHFLRFQNESGAIIDPYENEELQYSTPAFALAAACTAIHGQREHLIEPAARAMDHSTRTLEEAAARHCHEDFFPPMVARAFQLLRDVVTEERAAGWLRRIRSYDPHRTYRFGQGGGNWNVVALSGEALYEMFGMRDGIAYAEAALERQAYRFTEWGMYLDINSEAMAYDHFPRLWLADMLGSGYGGRLALGLREFLERGAWTSLFLQSSAGELPAGGRSSQHQWNEAAQCVTFEVFAKVALNEGNPVVAGVFKRAARLSLAALEKWIRPGGDLWIVKNRADSSQRHGYEPYSFYSQYNLLPMAILAIAHEHSMATRNVAEHRTPAEVGGFILDLRSRFHKVVANAAGTYVEIDTAGLPEYDPTGLLRIHFSHMEEQLGPSGGMTTSSSGTTAAVGVAWRAADGAWHRLAEFQKGRLPVPVLEITAEQPHEVSFQLTYTGDLPGANAVVESYCLTANSVEISWDVRGTSGPLRVVWPVLVNDGERERTITLTRHSLRIQQGTQAQLFVLPACDSLVLEDRIYPCRNGWAKLAVAEFDAGTNPLMRVTPGR